MLPEWLGQLTQLQTLDLSANQLTVLPEWLGQLTQLQTLNLINNQLTALPESLGQLRELQTLNLTNNQLTALPESLGQLTQLQTLNLSRNQLTALPESLGQLTQLTSLMLDNLGLITLPEWIAKLESLKLLRAEVNKLRSIPQSFVALCNLEEFDFQVNQFESLPEWLTRLPKLATLDFWRNSIVELPEFIAELKQLERIELDGNPLNPELAAAYKEGLDAVKRYLRAKAGAQVVLNEAKLILIGEGEVGKSCLLGALRGDEWVEKRDTTHGIEIKPVKVTDPSSGTEITLNGWDFGGQRVYRPTHQLFFSAPAVYLVVWKPSEGPQQGFVKEWIKLVKHREPEAKILVVATHGGPGARQPDIDRQEIWDIFGRETVIDFFFVDSRPDKKTGECDGIAELKNKIAEVAAALPEMGRTVPQSWHEARLALKRIKSAHVTLNRAIQVCKKMKMSEEDARLFLTIEHRLGHLIHYAHDPVLRDIVILKPDWLATAMSFVFDDKHTREAHGLVSHERLSHLWNDGRRAKEFRYPEKLHPVFLKLMGRYDLCYRVAEGLDNAKDGTSLIAQLVPDVKPDLIFGWTADVPAGEVEREQICRIVEDKSGQSAPAEGLFYQLIVRLHKYSLGRVDFQQSSHWQRGLVLDDNYNGRALMEHVGNDVRITVRAVYPEAFLSVLTHEVKWLVENFWKGLRCDVMVPCIQPCGKKTPGTGLFEVEKLIESKRKKRPEYPCQVCSEWQDIDCLLRNAPAATRESASGVLAEGEEIKRQLTGVRYQLNALQGITVGGFDRMDVSVRRILSKIDDTYTQVIQTLTDEAKDGPRLVTLEPMEPGFFSMPKWVSQKFRLTLWCEHSRMPLPLLNATGDNSGVYEYPVTRDWLVTVAPYVKLIATTLSLVVPVAAAAAKFQVDDKALDGLEKKLESAQKAAESVFKSAEKTAEIFEESGAVDLEPSDRLRARGASLRILHAFLKEKDPGFGGLVRVQNKRQEFLWVHSQFEKEY